MSKNLLASYFTNSSDLSNNSDLNDLAGRTFFDLISECKDFNERETIKNSDDDLYDIWPISDEFKNINSNSVSNEKNFIFAFKEPLADPLKALVLKHLGSNEAAKRLLPNSESVIADVNGLQILIKCGCYRSVVNLTTKILQNLIEKNQNNETFTAKSIYTPYSLQIWFIRIAILMKLKLFKEAEQELKQFENFEKPQFFYEFHPNSYPNRKGSMVPFGFRMLNVELSQYLGKSEECIANLYKLHKTVENIIAGLEKNENALKIWHDRKFKVIFSIVNILVFRKSYVKAIDSLMEISESTFIDKCLLWSCIGKLFVQIGDIKDASDSFIKANNFSKSDSTVDKARNLLNLSLLRIANGIYTEAYDFLKEANALVPDNSIIVNNMAFCLFYSGNLKEAIATIENHIKKNPNKHINESLIFNVCTLYELESAKAQQKKLNLLIWLNVYAGDGFYESCLQL